MSIESLEEWRDIPDYEGLYQVSDAGEVRGLDRVVMRNGRLTRIKGRILRDRVDRYASVQLYKDGRGRAVNVHRIVAEVFLGAPPAGMEVCHNDGDRLNNHLSNLRWGTKSENQYDRVRHGTHHNANRTSCINGHLFTPENTYVWSRRPNSRQCVACQRQHGRNNSARKAVSA